METVFQLFSVRLKYEWFLTVSSFVEPLVTIIGRSCIVFDFVEQLWMV